MACVFVWSAEEQGSAGPECPRPGGASRVWLHAALASLDADLRRRFATPLLFAAAPHAAALRQLGASLRASCVHAATRYEPALADADASTAAELAAHGMHLELHPGYLLHPPGDVLLDLSDFSGHFGMRRCVPAFALTALTLVTRRHDVSLPACLRAPPAAAAAAARAERRCRETLSPRFGAAPAGQCLARRAAAVPDATPERRHRG